MKLKKLIRGAGGIRKSPTPNPQTINSTQTITTGVRKSTGSYELVISAIILGLVGFGLDKLFGYTPILTITLGLVGFIGASISIFYRYKEAMSQHSAERNI